MTSPPFRPAEPLEPGASAVPFTRAQRTARNSLFSVAGFVYPILLTIVMTPVVLHFVGTERYGVYALASVFVGFLGVLDFGMGASVMKFVSEHLARRELTRANRVIGASLVVFIGVGIVGALVAVAIGMLFLEPLFKIHPREIPEARFVFVVAGIGFLLSMAQASVQAIPATLQRFDVSTLISASITTAAAAATAVVLVIGWGLRGMITVTALQPLAGLIAYGRAARKLLPGLRVRPVWDLALLRRMLSFSAYAFVGNVAGLVLLQLDRIVLGAFEGPRAVTYYVIPGNIAQRLHASAATLSVVALPVASELTALGEDERVQRLYTRATRFVILFVASLAIPGALFAHQLLRAWVGADLAAHSTRILQLLIATYALLALTALPYYVMLGRGRPLEPALFSVATAALNVALIFVLIPRYGAMGAAVAYVASMIFVPVFIWYVEQRALALPVTPWFRLAADFAVPVATQVFACVLLRQFADGAAALLGLLALTVPIVGTVYLFTGRIDAADRALLRALLHRR